MQRTALAQPGLRENWVTRLPPNRVGWAFREQMGEKFEKQKTFFGNLFLVFSKSFSGSAGNSNFVVRDFMNHKENPKEIHLDFSKKKL